MRFRPLLGVLFVVGCATASRPIPEAWRSVPEAARMTLPAAPHATDEVAIIDNQLMRGTKALTPKFAAIDSFDVSLDRREVIFSAKRTTNFDVGLVSLDGSDVHWIPQDPNDEVAVQWAPKGNKVSYVVHTPVGDIVRTVHVPTSTQLAVDFPAASVRALRWDADGQRYSAIVTSPDASERIESMRYGGEARRTDTPPSVRLDVSIEPIANGILLRPSSMRYGEKLPLVVWMSPRPYEWNDARGALLRNARVACAILTTPPDDTFWTAVRAIPWIDTTKTFLVEDRRPRLSPSPKNRQAGAPVVHIEADDTLAPGTWVRHGNRLSVSPALVQSFAAGYISAQLKGIPPSNGR